MKTVSQQQLARALGLTERRIRQLEDEKVVERIDGQRKYDLGTNKRRYEVYASDDAERVILEIQRAAGAIDDLFDELRALPMAEREAQGKRIGPALQNLQAWLNLSAAMASEAQRPLLRRYGGLEIGRLFEQALALLGKRLAAE